ncbi:TATA element modulatory factor-like [Argiope bruennichi]|uniref:TATA element modulatory factor-like n=1 Tax=Argiope bruennichi TaxID=94029 RepID=UPI002494DFD9|nr:TATA element modulatory factor-like [Argiope bruennichi]XP_055936423.1 TATA element modulatory factor-like [Argiope bruennichi]
MSWFDTAGIASFAKSALTTAQKTIDKALDIQEETAPKTDKRHTDSESFFEAFGLNDKPSTSTSSSKQSKPQTKPPEQSIHESGIPVQGSGFWTDTWGSFFEIKGQGALKSESKPAETIKKDISNDSKHRKEGTVLSQPHRASLFPAEPPVAQSSNDTQDKLEELNKSLQSDSLPDANAQKAYNIEESSDKPSTVQNDSSSEEASKTLVIEQPSPETVLDFKDSNDIPPVTQSSTEIFNTLDEVKENKVLNKLDCDNESNNLIREQQISSSVPTETFVSCTKNMDQSEFLELHMPSPSEKTEEKVESEYDVIEISKKEIPDNSMAVSSGSFTQIVSNDEKPANESSFYDNSSSTLVIPDLPVSENVANWECCALDSLSPDLFTGEEHENSDFLVSENEQNPSLKVTNEASPFHTMQRDSFNDNNNWSKSTLPGRTIDESQNSSNEEQNSHHSDGSSNSSKDDDDDTDTAEVKEYDAKSSSSNESHTTSSSSFVKCSGEENEQSFHRGHSPVSTTASERSDNTKHESEQNTSGDENETATSSDIEILSPPNGENGDRNASPLKHVWLTRPLRFRRSESPTSDSSKDSMMPVVNELDEVSYEDENNSLTTLYGGKEDELDCQKQYDEEEDNIRRLLQKQDELQTVLDAREKKIVELSKENIELQENEQRLKNLMQKMRVEQAKESRDITALTREFTQRLSHVESQLKETIKERNLLQQQLDETKQEIDKRILASDFEEVIKEKDQQIKELTEEGQKLAKKELTHTTIIKKLRAKEDEMDRTIKSQAEKLEDSLKEVERLRKSIGAKEEQEKKHIDVIRNLNITVKKLEKDVSMLKSDLEDSKEKEYSLKRSLDSTYKEFTDLQKSYSAKEKEVEELKSNLELKAKEDLQQKLENANKEAAREKEMLLSEMQQLRYTISRSQDEANLREKMFKDEIASLQKRLQEAEERNEELTKNMSSATRPLIRQIENLQATYTAQTISWEKIEKSLTDRLSDAQNHIAHISEKERAATEKYLEYQSKLTALESQNSLLRQEKLQLTSEIETLRTKIIVLEENKSRETYTLDKVKQNFNTEITKLKQERLNLENTMATCLEQLDIEKKKVKRLEEEIKIKDARAAILSGSSPCPSPTGSARSSISSLHNWSQDEGNEHGSITPVNSYRMSVYESLRLGSGSSLLENLQSQLKQREGEIFQLQSEINKLEQVKESMTRELVNLSEQNETLSKKVKDLEILEKEYKDLDQKYNTLLQMYGEKVEETEELQLDLSEVKSMYKAQIEELLMKQ